MTGRERPFVPMLGRFGLALALIAGLLASAFLGTRGVTAQDAPQADATVRFVHAVADGPPVDVLVDGTPAVQGLAYGAATEYAALPAGDHQVQVVPSGEQGAAPLVDTTVTAEAGQAYIVTVFGPAAQIEAQVQQVNLDATTPGQARLRLINAVPDGGEITVGIAGGDALFENVAYKATSDYRDGAPGTYDMTINIADAAEPVATVPGVTVQAGTVYDIVAIGEVGGATVTLLPLATQVSQPCGMVLGVGSEQDACLRIVHVAPGSTAVDVYVNGTQAVTGLEYGGATEFVTAPAGDAQIQVVGAGGTVDQAMIDNMQTFEQGQAYNVVVSGAPEEVQLATSEVDLTPLPTGQARLRVIHASPDAGDVDVVTADGATLFEAVGGGSTSDYLVVDAMSYDLQVRPAGEQTVAIQTMLDVQEGMVYDVIAIGSAEQGTLELLTLQAQAATRVGEVATPMSSPETGSASPPAGGTAIPATPPATPVGTSIGETEIPATEVQSTPVPTETPAA